MRIRFHVLHADETGWWLWVFGTPDKHVVQNPRCI